MVEIKAPLIAGIQITGRCNLRCKYCYAHPASATDISLCEVKTILEQFKKMGVFQILIEGGEPFLHPDFFQILESSLHYYPSSGILTNGTQINKGEIYRISRLLENYPHLSIQVSLDSHLEDINDRTRGMTNRVTETIRLLAEAKVDVTVAITIHRQNIDYAESVIDYFYPLVKKFHYMNLMPTRIALQNHDFLFPENSRLEKFWDDLSKKIQSMSSDISVSYPYDTPNAELGKSIFQCQGCLAGITRVNITPDLNVIACPISSEEIMGNLKEADFESIWFSQKAEEIRDNQIPLCSKNKVFMAQF